jgi:hypothetical protein
MQPLWKSWLQHWVRKWQPDALARRPLRIGERQIEHEIGLAFDDDGVPAGDAEPLPNARLMRERTSADGVWEGVRCGLGAPEARRCGE